MNDNNRPQPTSHAADGAANSFNIQRVLNALRCWWKIATPIALLLAAGTGAVAYYLHKPTYTASASLLIKEQTPVILRSVDIDSRRFIQNQMEILRSSRLLGRLVENPAILATPEFKDSQDVAATLGQKLQIRQRGQSDIYLVSFTSVSPEKAELVVKEVAKAYLAFHSQSELEQDSNIILLLNDKLEKRKAEMGQLREIVKTLSIQITGNDPYQANPKEQEEGKSHNPFASLQDSIVKYEVDQEFLAAYIKSEEEFQAQQKLEIPASVIEKEFLIHPRYQALVAHIETLRQKQTGYEKTGNNLPGNALFKHLQSELAASTKALEALKVDLRKEIKESMETKFAAENADKLNAMKQEYASNETRLKIMNEKYAQKVGSAKKHTGDSLDLEFAKAKLEQVTKIYEEISSRILAITTEQQAPERVEMFKDASLPLSPDELVPWKKVGMFGGAAFMIPFALAIAWEQLFRRVTSRGQLEMFRQRLSVVGEVTSLPSKLRGSAAANRSTERDVLLFEESIDGLRTYLTLTESLRGLRILAITSACSKEGKTSLAAQLAVSIARATGERILIVDGDMRAPDIHNIFDKDLSPGLAEVLRNECPIEEAIETEFSDKLHILTAGRLTASPHRLLGNNEFSDLLDKLSSIYRYIILDTPPILPASEALVMARAADAAILCVRRDHSRLDQVEEAHRRMVAAGVNTAGAVLNGIPIQHYAHKYGSYAYNRVSGSTST